MRCPRCAAQSVEPLASSPVPGAWEVQICTVCHYSWRDTEPARRTEREHYPERFRLTTEQLESAIELPSVPALRERS